MTMDESGPLNGSMMYITDSEVLDIASENVTKVIPLAIPHPSNRAAAWNAAVKKSFRNGSTPQIYMWLSLRREAIPPAPILSSAKAFLPVTNGTFSLVSQKNLRGLVRASVSSSNQTAA